MQLKSLDFADQDTVKQFIEDNDIHDIADLNAMLKQISGVFIEQLLESERDEHLGYERYQKTSEPKTNARNGYSKKNVRSVHGEVDLDIPAKPKACVAFCRDRAGTFEPTVVKKHQRDISELEDKVISMYAKGMTTRDIQAHLADIYVRKFRLRASVI
jgi:transposase-like protein